MEKLYAPVYLNSDMWDYKYAIWDYRSNDYYCGKDGWIKLFDRQIDVKNYLRDIGYVGPMKFLHGPQNV